MSSRDKQISELIPMIFDKICEVDGVYHNLSPDKMLASVEAYGVAEIIIDANYRKKSEVAEEIKMMIEQSTIGTLNIGGDYIIIPKCIVHAIEEAYAERSGK